MLLQTTQSTAIIFAVIAITIELQTIQITTITAIFRKLPINDGIICSASILGIGTGFRSPDIPLGLRRLGRLC
ncbi:hypothetical protein BZA77DRAFT_312374 [Pyronema omphalodes]|nr:hypothetical protein BZA77DRAFT_312374 [Pyronema omphalodes]